MNVGPAASPVASPDSTGQRPVPRVFFRDDLTDAKAVDRRAHLLATLEDKDFDAAYEVATPREDNRWSFRPSKVTDAYLTWVLLTDLCHATPAYGHMETRGLSLISHGREELAERMRRFLEPSVSNEDMARACPEIMAKYCRYEGTRDRARIIEKMKYSPSFIRRMQFKPFDSRWHYSDAQRPLWSEPSAHLVAQAWDGNVFLISRMAGVKQPEGAPSSSRSRHSRET